MVQGNNVDKYQPISDNGKTMTCSAKKRFSVMSDIE